MNQKSHSRYANDLFDGECPYGDLFRTPHKGKMSRQYYVLNESMVERPVWVTGELYCAGAGLAKGYWNDDQKTESSFIRHPDTGERLYKTGDLGRYLPDGNIEDAPIFN